MTNIPPEISIFEKTNHCAAPMHRRWPLWGQNSPTKFIVGINSRHEISNENYTPVTVKPYVLRARTQRTGHVTTDKKIPFHAIGSVGLDLKSAVAMLIGTLLQDANIG
ncbi:MAG: hypothetical protein AAF483_09340 [Planctomycetota bacterium]